MPYSNRRGEGFEQAIAQELAEALGWRLEFSWWQDGRFVVRDLNQGKCDLIVGADPDDERLLTSQPYYRSSWVLVTRKGEKIDDLEGFLRRAKRVAFPGNSPAETLIRRLGKYEDLFFYLNVGFQG